MTGKNPLIMKKYVRIRFFTQKIFNRDQNETL